MKDKWTIEWLCWVKRKQTCSFQFPVTYNGETQRQIKLFLEITKTVIKHVPYFSAYISKVFPKTVFLYMANR